MDDEYIMEQCECQNWARAGQKLLTKHHKNCPSYDVEGESYALIVKLLDGIEAWADEEDGIHPGCWEAYREGTYFIGQFSRIKGGK